MNSQEICEKILGILDSSSCIPIYKVARDAGISLTTASKYCHVLAAQNKIRMEIFGNMKLVSKAAPPSNSESIVLKADESAGVSLWGVEGSAKKV